MHSKNEAHHQHAIIKLLGWSIFLAAISLIYFGLTQSKSIAHAASSPINAQVCSGGNHSPAIISVTPADAMTVTQKNTTIQITADWVTAIAIKRGSTTLASATGNNQSNETFSLPLTLDEGSNALTISTQGGCPVNSSSASYHLTYIKNAANVTATATRMLSPRLTGFYQPMGVRVFVEINGTVYEAITHSDLTWELPEGTITPDLEEKSYAIRVFTQNSSGTILFDKTYPNALSIDLTMPTVSLSSPLTHTERSPKLSGTTNDPYATITITINGRAYTATNNRDGTWMLPKGTIAKLSNGEYVVKVTATDTAGNIATIQKTIRIKASGQVSFVLAPNTGYLRLGATNIQSRYLYLALAAFVILLLSIISAGIRYLRRKKTTSQ